MRQWVLGGMAAVTLAGCSLVQQAKSSAEGINTFHQQFNAGQYAAIWQASAPGMQSAVPQAQFVALMTAYHAKLGDFQSAKVAGSQIKDNGPADYAVLTQTSTYAKGTVTEQFAFQTVNGQQELLHFSTHNLQANGS